MNVGTRSDPSGCGHVSRRHLLNDGADFACTLPDKPGLLATTSISAPQSPLKSFIRLGDTLCEINETESGLGDFYEVLLSFRHVPRVVTEKQMSRVALIGCTAVLLFGSVWQSLAAAPTESKRRVSAPVTRSESKPVAVARPVKRPAAVVRQVTPNASSVISPVSRVVLLRPAKTPSTTAGKVAVKPVTRAATKPVISAAIRSQRQDTRPARKLAATFDRSARNGLLPAGSAPLLQKGPQPLPVLAQPRTSTRSDVAKKVAAAAGAAVVGAGVGVLAKPAATGASNAGPSTPAKPAGKLPLANLNHPHMKPVARVLPSIPGHKNANRPRLPLYVLAPALLGASWMGRDAYVWNRRSYDNVGWVAPIPSCYVGGTVFYRNPWTGDCFNFESAEPGERFAVGTKVYTWTPAKYPSVEDMVDDQERTGTSVMADPFRIANPTAPVSRVSTEPTSRQPLSLDATDCSSCLTAIGPVEVTGGQCSVTISNYCGLPVAFDLEFQRNGQTFCQTKLDAASASEVIVCTQPCTAFLDSHVNLKSAIPKLANSAPFKGCRPHWAALEEQAR